MARAIGIACGLAALLPALAAAQTPTLSFSRARVPGGYDVTVVIALKVAAPKAGVRLSLTSGAPTVARFAATGTGSQSITIPGGQRTASVSLKTLPVVADTRVAITVATSTLSARKILAVQPLRPASVSMGPNAVYGLEAESELVTITLAEPAPKEGLRLQLVSTLEAIAPVPFVIEAGATTARMRVGMREVAQITPTLVGVAHADIAAAEARRLVQATAAPGVASLHLYPLPTIVSVAPSGPVVTLDAKVRIRTTIAPAPVVSGAPVPRPVASTVAALSGVSPTAAGLFQEQLGSYVYGQTEMVTTHTVSPRTGEQIPVGVNLLRTTGRTTFEFVAPALRVVSLEPARRTVTPTDSIEFTVKLERPVQQDRLSMAVSVSSPEFAFVRGGSVFVAGGQQTGKFMLITTRSSARRTVRVSVPAVTAGGVITGPNGEATMQRVSSALMSTDVDIVPLQLPQIKGVVPLQPTIAGGQSGIIEVRFTPAELTADQSTHPPHTLTLISSDPAVARTSPVTVDTRTAIAQVPVTTTAPVNDTRVTFTAAFNGVVVAGAAASGALNVTAPLPRVTALRAASTSLTPGDSVPVTVTIDRPASGAGLTFLLTSTAPLALAVPSSINISAGASSTSFFARAQPTVTATTTVSITTPATPLPAGSGPVVDGTSNTIALSEPLSTGPINIVPLRVTEVGFAPSPVFGGLGDVELTVRLSASPTTARTIALRVGEGASLCTLPASLTVPAGSSEVRHRFSTGRTGSEIASCSVSATLAEVPFTVASPSRILRVHPVPTIVDIVPAPRGMVGGGALTGQVHFVAGTAVSSISGSAATIPLTITSNSGAVRGTTVMVPAGAAFVGYTLSTSPVSAPTPVQLTYTLAGASTTREFSLTPPAPRLVTWTLDRSNVIGGDSVTATLALDRPAAVPEVIAFNSSTSSIIRPADVTIPVGATRATVRIATGPVNQVQQGSIRALQRFPVAVGGAEDGADQFRATLTSNLTVEPLSVRELLVDQPVGFGSVQRPNVTLILGARAPAGGAKVVLASSFSGVVTVGGARLPLVITVPGGADRVTVALRTQQVEQLTDVTLSAFPAPEGSADGPFTGAINAATPLGRTAPMQLLPIPILTNLRVEPTSVIGGNAVALLGDLTNSVRPTLSTPTPPTLSMVVNSDRPDVVASGTLVVRPGDTAVRFDRPTTATTADVTVRFTVTLVITRLGATLLVRAP